MKNFIQKYHPKTKFQKAHILVFLVCSIYIPADYFLSIKGRDFPLEQDLTYTTGTLDYYRAASKNAMAFTMLRTEPPESKETFFGCSYAAYISAANSGCMDKKSLEPYLGKQATAGWYYQPEFLGFKNNRPQLVSLEVRGEQIKTYKETVALMQRINKSSGYIAAFFIALGCLIYVFCLYPKNTDDLEQAKSNLNA